MIPAFKLTIYNEDCDKYCSPLEISFSCISFMPIQSSFNYAKSHHGVVKKASENRLNISFTCMNKVNVQVFFISRQRPAVPTTRKSVYPWASHVMAVKTAGRTNWLVMRILSFVPVSANRERLGVRRVSINYFLICIKYGIGYV